ncbi:hypothetical protein B0H14DRAFT_2566129 [Mycena olivaceomarginata]|nr:hypothetical protein B0H14DRAFT_2566129 [Mycena olivaceomarginata]
MASDITKCRSHAEAQRRYREKNLEATLEKARERMRLLRKQASRSIEEVAAAVEKRRDGDTDYNEYRRCRKFVQKFGQQNFLEHYLLLYKERGTKHLPGVKILAVKKSLEHKDNIRVLDVGHNADSDLHGRYEFRGGGNDKDHDQNTRKYWFVVFGVGLFTSQCVFFWRRWQGTEACVVPRKDALQAAGNEDGVHVFITRNQATRAWTRHCCRRHTTGCHKTRDPKAHSGDMDSNTDSDTPAKRSKTPGSVKQEKKPVMHPSTIHAQRTHTHAALFPGKRVAQTPAPTLPVKCAAHTPAATVPIKRALEVVPLSTEKKKDEDADYSMDDDLFKSDSSADVPLAKSLAASRTTSRTLFTLHEDEDVPMPAAVAIPTPVSPTILSVSSLSTMSATLSTFSSVSGPLRARSAARPSTLSQHMLFNRKSLVLYNDA